MFSPEVQYLVRKEQYEDLRRNVIQAKLVQIAQGRQPKNRLSFRSVAVWSGMLLVKWGSRLERYANGTPGHLDLAGAADRLPAWKKLT
jgi:uncharacterized RmlC-like cupin family protein